MSTQLALALAAGVLLALVIAWRYLGRRRRPARDEVEPEPEQAPVTAPPAFAMPVLAERFGPYVLLDRLGEGGMAEVHAAVATGRRTGPCVVKRLRSDLASDPAVLGRFQIEADLGARLRHDNIVSMLEAGDIDGRHYLVHEYVAGRDVGRLCRRMIERKERPLSAAAILYLAHEVLQGLAHAHDSRADDGAPLGVVHRDVSPENVLVSKDGEVKLLDFGIARVGGAEAPGGAIAGNVDFMAPEQASGQIVDRRADLFSLGMVMYYCAARAPLYRGKTPQDRLVRAVAGPSRDEWAYVEGLPPPLPAVLARALAVGPPERYQTAAEMRAALAPHIEGGAAEVAATVQRLFGAELAVEHERLAAATPRLRPRTVVPIRPSART